MEVQISILNIISVILLSFTFGTLVVRYRTLKNKSHILIAFSFTLLLFSTLTNVIEHGSIFKSIDMLEDLLKILFIPIFIFSVHSSIIDSELKKRMISEKKFKAIFNQAYTLIGLLDKDGKLIEANDSAINFGKFNLENNKGKLFNDTDWWQHSNEEAEKMHSAILKAQMGEMVRFETSHLDAQKQERFIDFSLKPLYDDSGELLFLIPEGRDITEIKSIRLELEKHRDQLEYLVKERTEELGTVNEELSAINEEIFDKNLLLEKSNAELIENKFVLEKTLKELKDAQDQLIHSEKMASIGILSAGVAHEINNPVNFINSGVMGLKKALQKLDLVFEEYRNILNRISDPTIKDAISEVDNKFKKEKNIEAIKVLIGHIETGISRTTAIVSSLSFFMGSNNDVKSEIDIHKIIESVLTILYNEYKNNIEIEKLYYLERNVKCIPGKISQVIMNIISNAIQAIENKGVIHITTKQYKKFAELSIKDTGFGIEPKNLKKIFDPFFTTKAVGKGTGLGLSISYKIIQQHNGEIVVNSELSKGTEFIVRIPIEE